MPGLGDYQEACERVSRRAMSKEVYDSLHRDGARLSFAAAIAYALGEQLPAEPPPSAPAARLTKREREVAELIAEGLTNKEIATRLVISPRTAQGHVEHILTKLEFTSRTQIAAWVVEQRRENL
jgi:non-specific serine/threonine protein kinase